MIDFRTDALFSLGVRTIDGDGNYVMHNGIAQPTEAEIQAKIAELEAAEPLRLLRIERNRLLQETDWRMTTDYPYSDQAEWATYRTALRDLPATATPTLDEQGNLIVDWPTAPSEV